MPPPDPRPTRVRWLVFALAAATSWLLYFHRYAWGVIKPNVKEEFGFDDAQLGWLDSAFNLTYALLQVPTGLLGDLYGPALILPLSVLGWSGAMAATGIASGFASFLGVRSLFGVWQASAYPNLSKVTRSWFPVSVRTTVQGLVATFAGRAGGACATVVVGTLLLGGLGLSWRAALAEIAGLGAVLALAYALCFRNSPRGHPWVNEAEARLISGDEPAPSASARSETPRWVFDRRPRVLLSFAGVLIHLFGAAFADMLYVYWIPLFLKEFKGLTTAESGLFASLPLWAGALGGVAGGWLNDRLARLGNARLARCGVGLAGKLVAATLVVVSLGPESGRAVMVVLAVARFFNDWSQPTVWGTVTDIGGRAVGTVFGIVNMAGSIGAFAAGPVLGTVKQSLGWPALFLTIAGVELVSGLAWLLVDPRRRLVIDLEGDNRSR